jgi:uncharacterized protein YbaP (TraB family)
MKKYMLLGCGLGLLIVVLGQKVKIKRENYPATSYDSMENALLWKVSGNGLRKTSYIFGTMHLMCAEDARLSDTLQRIVRRSDHIYFEIDLDDMAEMAGVAGHIMMKNGTRLPDLLTEDEYAKIDDYFRENPAGMPMTMLQSLKPFFLNSIIAEQRMTCAVKGGMERAITDVALKYNKEIRGLETVQFQSSVLDSIPYERQAKELVKYIDSLEKNSRLAEELVEVYKQQDLKKIEELTKQEDGGVADFLDLMLYDRNADWAEKMSRIMRTDGVLFAIGAAHLPGERGVINLLREKGFTVSSVKGALYPSPTKNHSPL